MNILVTGSNGQLGAELINKSRLIDSDDKFITLTNSDYYKLNSIKKELDKVKPDIIINCCAYTKVDESENNFELANLLNYKFVKLLVDWSNKNSCRLIHISTDYVFDGKSKVKYTEESKANPLNVYGKTKLKGDIYCLNNCKNIIILRTSWLYSTNKSNFLNNILNQIKTKNEIKVVSDQFGSPTYTSDLANIIFDIIFKNVWKSGLYNYSGEAVISWFDFASDILRLRNSDIKIKPIKTKDINFMATRPKFSALDNSKIYNTFKISAFSYKDSLKTCLKNLENEE